MIEEDIIEYDKVKDILSRFSSSGESPIDTLIKIIQEWQRQKDTVRDTFAISILLGFLYNNGRTEHQILMDDTMFKTSYDYADRMLEAKYK